MMTGVIRVLYVDDERDLLELGKLYLETSGDYSIVTAESATAALELLRSEHFDAIVSDYQMPEMDGIRFLVEVRTRYGHTPFILFTGRGREEIVVEALNNGADFYIQKGGDPDAQYAELSHKIRTSVERCVVDRALKLSEEQYRRIVETAHEGIWAMDGDFITTYVNERMAGMLGFTIEEMLGKPVNFFMPVLESPDHHSKMQERIKGKPGSYERQFLAKDGTIRIFHVSATALIGEDGSFQGSFAMFTDLTGRVHAEEALRKSKDELEASYKELARTSEELSVTMGALAESENLYRTLFKEMLNGIAIHEIICDSDGNPTDYRFINVNQAFEQMTGLNRDDLIGRTVLEVMPDTEPFWIERYGKVALTGTPDHFDHYSRVLDRFYEVTVYQNAPEQFTTVIADVTTSKRAEEALRKSEEQVKRKLDALLSPEGDIRTLELADIIDIDVIQTLMDDFYALTGTGVAILDLTGTILVSTGWQDICTKFHRVHPVTSSHCHESDVVLSGETAPGTYRIYKCRNNMWDIVTPIVVGGRHIGNLFLGQFIFEDEIVDYELFRSQARQYGFNEEEYLAALDKVPRWNRERVATVMDFYTRFAGLISVMGYRNVQLARMVAERDQLVNTLRQSEERFRSYFDNAPYGVFIANDDGRYLEVNPEASVITGYSRDELVTMSIPDLLPHGSMEAGARHFRSLFETGNASGELLFRHKDGSLRYWSVDAARLSPTRFIGFVQDITRRKQSEDALAESEEVFREVFNNANDAIFLHEILPDGDPGRYFRVNDIACELLGYSRDELYRMSPWDISSPMQRENIPEIVAKIKSEGFATFEAEFQKKDGSFFPVEMSTHTFMLQGRKVAISIARDITRRKQAEEEIKRSERKYRELIEFANEAITVAQDGMLKLANARMTELTGYTEEELYTRPFREFIHPDDRAMVVERYQKRLSHEDIPSRYTFRLSARNGDTRRVEISSIAIDYEDRPATLNFLTDITVRRQTEEALRESEEFNRGLVENIPDIVIVYGHDRKIRYVNPAANRLLGYPVQRLIGTDILSYVVPMQRSETGKHIEERLKTGSTGPLEIDILAQGGEQMTFITKGTPVRYHDEQAVLLLLTNISDRKILETKLVARAEELTHLSSSLAIANKKLNLLGSLTRHDIINKLALISGYTSQIRKKAPDQELVPLFEKHDNALRRINDYLQFTRTYEEIGIHAPAWLNVHDMVRKASFAIPHGGIVLDINPAGVIVYADPLFEKIFTNLLDNSVRHGGVVTRIGVSYLKSDDGLTIIWDDDGTGIPEGEKERIFDRGYGKNTGLGLFLSREILDITGITIRETGVPGEGARFEIIVPHGKFRETEEIP